MEIRETHTQKISTAMVPKIEKKNNDGLYERVMENIMLPKPRKTPNITEALSGMSDEMSHFRRQN